MRGKPNTPFHFLNETIMKINFVTLNIDHQILDNVLALKNRVMGLKKNGETETLGEAVMAFQEVNNRPNTLYPNLHDVLGKGCHHHFSKAMSFDPTREKPSRCRPETEGEWEHGHSLVSTLPLKQIKIVSLGPSADTYWRMADDPKVFADEYMPHTAIIVKIEAAPCWVIAAQTAKTLDPTVSSTVRIEQVFALMQSISKTIPTKDASIIMGDFGVPASHGDLGALRVYYNFEESSPEGTSHIFFRNTAPLPKDTTPPKPYRRFLAARTAVDKAVRASFKF